MCNSFHVVIIHEAIVRGWAQPTKINCSNNYTTLNYIWYTHGLYVAGDRLPTAMASMDPWGFGRVETSWKYWYKDILAF